jgi:hypothetical protein
MSSAAGVVGTVCDSGVAVAGVTGMEILPILWDAGGLWMGWWMLSS